MLVFDVNQLCSVYYLTGVEGITAQEVAQHLEMGKKLLAAGQLADALSHYHAAVGEFTFTAERM